MSGRLPNWLKLVANKRDYIAALRFAIWNMHGAWGVHRETVHVHETFRGKTVWKGEVEVFDITEHPKAKRVYAWAHLDGPKDDKTRFVAVLELPPVKDAKTAVQASIMADSPKGRSQP
jgi:hypothetical protein